MYTTDIRKFALVLLLTVLAFRSYSQVDFGIRRQKLKPTVFDSTKERILVYEVPNAIIYFKQDDIKNLIVDHGNKISLGHFGYKAFLDTLMKMTPKIWITDFYYFYGDAQRDSIFKKQPENQAIKELSEEFYFLGAALILQGKFMVCSKLHRKFLSKGLVAKRRKEMFGQRTLQFYLPGELQFYYIITQFGE